MTKEVLSAIQDAVGTQVFGIWFLIGAAFVFFMQAGFAMVEAGFTRAKNAGNIIMKNLMDFCIGTCVFIPLGFGILLGEDALGGFIGTPTLGIFTDYANFDWSNFVFNHRIRSNGRTYQILILLYLFRSDLRCCISDRGTLDLGRWMACKFRIP